jgi:DNA primase
LEDLSIFIPEEKIAEIRASCSIVAVISSYASLTKAGTNYKGLCPFHEEKTPSFVVSEAKKIFHCFGCGASGDVFTFLMKFEHMSFQSAVRLLAKRQGISLPEKELSPEQRKKRGEREEQFSINQIAAQFYHEILLHNQRGKKARDYLQQRGIDTACITAFSLGFAPEGWNALLQHLKTRQVSLIHAQNTGLIIPRGTGHYYDRFRERIMFPIFNMARQIVGFGGRVIGTGEPKYLNSPESQLFTKRNQLYGLHVAAPYLVQHDEAILVEGYFDLLSLHQAGIKHVVAPLGTALTVQHIQLLKRYTTNIITVFDADTSGEKAMIRSLTPFLEQGISPRMVLLPAGHDPDSFVRRRGAQAFAELVKNAVPLLDFVLSQTMKRFALDTAQGKIRASEEVIPLLRNIAHELERDLYMQKVAQILGIKESYLIAKIGNQPQAAAPHFSSQRSDPDPALAAAEKAERMIVELMLLHPDIIATVDENAFLEEFVTPELREVGRLLCSRYREAGTVTITDVLHSVTDEPLKQFITEISFKEQCGAPPLKILEDCIHRIRMEKVRKQRETTKRLLQEAEAAHDEASCSKLQRTYQNLIEEEKRIQHFRIITSEN